MKLFRIRGGVHPDYRKTRTQESAIVQLPMPKRLYLPLQQHIGSPAEPVVKVGERVLKGQQIAAASGPVSVPVHAPTSGTVVGIENHMIPHPSGLAQRTIVIEPDGKDEWADLPEAIADPFAVRPNEIADRVAAAGIVGLGGAAFPSAVKLGLRQRHSLDLLLLNGAECEPYLTCDDRVMREHADEVVDGARIMAYALGTPQIIIAIENNKPRALEAITSAAAVFQEVKVVGVPVRYPMGSERHLAMAISGRETPAGKLTADVGVVVHNVGTARAVHQAVRAGRPLISRVVTVSGNAVAKAQNIEVPLGSLVSEVLNFCGGFSETPRRVVSGGPMMGQPLPSLEVPVVKGTSGLLGLTVDETNEQAPGPCIRCGSCVESCPCGLVPMEIAARVRNDDLDGAVRALVLDCVSCGSCAYACPAHIPLVQYFDYAKGRVRALDRQKTKQNQLKVLAEARRERMEKVMRAKREAAAARKTAPKPAAAEAPKSDVSA